MGNAETAWGRRVYVSNVGSGRRRIAPQDPIDGLKLTYAERAIATKFALLLKDGTAPSPSIISEALRKPDGEIAFQPTVVTKYLTKLPDILGDADVSLRDFTRISEPWPVDMPLQTVGDLSETLQHFYAKRNTQNMPDRLPYAVREWVEENFDNSVHPGLQVLKKKSNTLKNHELVPQDVAVVDLLVRPNAQKSAYLYPTVLDALPDLQASPAFASIESEYTESYLRNAVFMVPGRYEQARELRRQMVEAGKEDPTKGMRLGEVFGILEKTKISEDKTLDGISGQNLYLLLSRRLPFDQMQRKLLSAS